jgi:hypothetical protein
MNAKERRGEMDEREWRLTDQIDIEALKSLGGFAWPS